jgi:secreted Zn-dependent insulinase-like peptidase
MLNRALLPIYSEAYIMKTKVIFKQNIRSFEFDISGFSSKIEFLVRKALDTFSDFFRKLLTNPDFISASFAESKEILEKSEKEIKNKIMDRMLDILRSVLELNRNPLKEIDHEALSEISIEDLKCFASRLFRSLNFYVRAEGNVSNHDVLNISDHIKNNFMNKIFSFIDYQVRIVKIPKGTTVIDAGFRLERNTFALLNYYQIGIANKRNRILTNILARRMVELMLKDVLQCGIAHNILTNSIFETNICGVWIYIQSDLGDPFDIDEKIESFLKTMSNDREVLKFDEYKEDTKEESMLLEDEEEISLGSSETEDVSKEDFIRFVNKFINPDSKKRRKLTLIAFPKEYTTNRYVIKDIVKFKKKRYLYPSI